MTPFYTTSFLSIWYWALTIVIWTLVSQRALGVPHDMLLRAVRLPEVAARVDTLAHIAAERVNGIAETTGVLLAALAGFCLATLAVLGFEFRVELALALLPLVRPLCLVAARTARLARRVRAERLRGEPLRRLLARHRAWNQSLAIAAMFAAAFLAATREPGFFPR